jgi:hypothetical protein
VPRQNLNPALVLSIEVNYHLIRIIDIGKLHVVSMSFYPQNKNNHNSEQILNAFDILPGLFRGPRGKDSNESDNEILPKMRCSEQNELKNQ